MSKTNEEEDGATTTTPTNPPHQHHKIQVIPLEPSDIPEASRIMAYAFCDSPSYVYMCALLRRRDQRIAALQWLFQQNLKLMLDRSPQACQKIVLVLPKEKEPGSNGNHDNRNEGPDPNDEATTTPTTTTSSKMIGAFLWTPVQHEELGLLTLLYYGLYQIPFRFGGISAISRLLGSLDDMKQAWNAFAAANQNDNKSSSSSSLSSNGWIQLERMTVLPDYQGQGVGRQALQQMLLANTTSYVRLATQEERNVVFYQRLEFQVIGERQCGGINGETYHSWFMVRRPSPAAAAPAAANNNHGQE
ncbi:hypothetical protein ACA910_007551 [Epithemia clementina (nom. ined.)]